ncbi:MAG: PAS domain-containing sensor histidine kinase [Alphaproteobacteria bacterium]|nr:PAS domain-containing sensor histidine kinase [Alphaproteobacteria bacterium]
MGKAWSANFFRLKSAVAPLKGLSIAGCSRFIAEQAQRFALWSFQTRLRDKMVIALVIASVASGLATYAAMTRSPFFANDPATIMILSLLDLGFLVLLGTVVTHRLYQAWHRRNRNLAGSKLQIRMINVFALLTVAPAMLVAMFAAAFFYFGVETWFSNHVRTSLNESLEVAQAYLEEHKQVLRADAMAMGNDLNRQAALLSQDPVRFNEMVSAQAYMRNLTEVLVFDGSGKILARSGLTFALTFEPITDDMRARASQGDVVLLVSDNDDRVRALLRLDNFVDTYLFVGRPVEPKVLAHMAATQTAVDEYKQLEGKRSGLQIIIGAIFVVVALLLLLAAVWIGINFAMRLTKPIGDLIAAANRVRGGDLRARVAENAQEGDDEIDLLVRAFNRMTTQLATQRTELIDANRQLDFRRRFSEAVLSGVSAGVIGLDNKGTINLMNASAAAFFEIEDPASFNGKPLSDLSPEIQHVIKQLPRGVALTSDQVEIRRPDQPARTILVRVSSEQAGFETNGYVVTFDDVSDLLSAQRKAAWADVARRIAHEIKNPLTPIQLSAERLRRKYAKEIVTDPDVFQTCTETIVRHVDDIGRMVDEFSAFARMPAPVMTRQDLREIVRQAVFLQSNSRPNLSCTQDIPSEPCVAECDVRQIAQALTNLLKNAAEAIDAREAMAKGPLPKGMIHVDLSCDGEDVTLRVEDNGKGLPVQERNTLTEPYVTTRRKGTGLGLAIVKKIMEDHHGQLVLTDRDGGGAIVSLIWPLRQGPSESLSKDGESDTLPQDEKATEES